MRVRQINGNIQYKQNCTLAINMKEFCHNYDMMEAIRLRGSYGVGEVYGGEIYVGVGAEV